VAVIDVVHAFTTAATVLANRASRIVLGIADEIIAHLVGSAARWGLM
jgi:hypothetical protein